MNDPLMMIFISEYGLHNGLSNMFSIFDGQTIFLSNIQIFFCPLRNNVLSFMAVYEFGDANQKLKGH